MINVILADDHRLFQQSVSQLLNRYKRINIVAEFDTGKDVIAYLQQVSELPDILISDVRMPEIDGFELLDTVKKTYPSIKVIMLSMFDSVQNIREAIDMGAAAYLDKSVSPDILVTAINEVYDHGIFETTKTKNAFSAAIKSVQSNNTTFKLSSAEERVIILICKELTNAEIAKRLNKSVRTVENLRQSIMEKSGAKNVAGVVKYAIKTGLYNPHNEH